MPLTPPTVIPLVQAGLSGNGILGIAAPLLATAVSNGFTQYTTSALTVTTKDTGTAGGGPGNGLGLFLAEPILISAMQGTFSGNGINGAMRNNVINAIAFGISQSLKSAVIITAHTGVGAGTGFVTLVVNTPASITFMITNFVAIGISGVYSTPLATAIAQGIDIALPSATGIVAITGAGSPYAAVGIGTGKVL